MSDVLVLGAEPDALAAAALLAKGGLRVVVLERAAEPGGTARSREIHPGFHAPGLAAAPGPLRPALQALDLRAHGLELVESPARLAALPPAGPALVLWDDAARTAESIAAHSARDAARWSDFQGAVAAVSALLAETLDLTPPDPEEVGLQDVWPALRVGLGFRRLQRGQAYGLLRWLPMPVADFADEWFESEALRAALCGRGVQSFFGGPRSAGTTANLLLQAALGGGHPAGACVFARGGPAALARALAGAARAAGAEIRTGVEVARLLVREERVAGAVLASGESLEARAVLSSLDPRRALLGLVDPVLLPPDDLWRLRNLRQRGVVAKLDLALAALPEFPALRAAPPEALRGRLQLAPGLDGLEQAFDQAKYGEPSSTPLLELTLPSLSDPALAPPGKHVLSALVQYAPRTLRSGDWDARQGELAERALQTLEAHAPGLRALVLAQQLATPKDLEREFGLGGGHPLQLEPSLEQLFACRPLLGWARYRAALSGLYLCGAATHPGLGQSGASGANAAREILKDLG